MTSAEIQKYQPNKRVLFQENVTIHNFEAEDGVQRKSPTHNRSRRKSLQLQNASAKHNTESVGADDETSRFQKRRGSTDGRSEPTTAEGTVLPRRPPSCYSVQIPSENAVEAVRYSFLKDRLRNVLLQLSVPIGPSYGPKGVMVKANLHGTRVRVMACSKKPTTTSDGQTVKTEYNETFPLPVEIDPDRLTARVDNLGYLLISAPVVRL